MQDGNKIRVGITTRDASTPQISMEKIGDGLASAENYIRFVGIGDAKRRAGLLAESGVEKSEEHQQIEEISNGLFQSAAYSLQNDYVGNNINLYENYEHFKNYMPYLRGDERKNAEGVLESVRNHLKEKNVYVEGTITPRIFWKAPSLILRMRNCRRGKWRMW